MDVGTRIKMLRKTLGYSAEDLADNIGVSPATIYRYESSDIVNMRIDKLKLIAKALNTTPAYLMGWEDESSPLPIPENKGEIELMPTNKPRITFAVNEDIFAKLKAYQADNDCNQSQAILALIAKGLEIEEATIPVMSQKSYDILDSKDIGRQYRELDEFGKRAVSRIIEVEYARCTLSPALDPNLRERLEAAISAQLNTAASHK